MIFHLIHVLMRAILCFPRRNKYELEIANNLTEMIQMYSEFAQVTVADFKGKLCGIDLYIGMM